MIEHHWEPSSILPCCHDRNSSRHSRHVVTSSSSSSSTNNNNDNNKTFHASRHSRRQQRSKSTTRRRGSCCHRHSSGKTTGHAKWLTSIMSLLFLILSIGMDPVEAAFHGIRMEYKPPVKSSVRKLLSNDPRSGAFSSSPSSSTSTSFTQGSSSSPTFHRNTGSNGKSKRRSEQPAAHVGYYAPTMPSTNTQQNSSAQRVRNVRLSFEQRMRQLVLGTRDVKGTTLDTTNTSARGSSSSSTSPPSSSATSTTTTTTTTLSNFKTETTATTTPAFSQPKSKRMAAKNVHHIETLSEFQQIVGNEQERIVVVRFYATYCKVREWGSN